MLDHVFMSALIFFPKSHRSGYDLLKSSDMHQNTRRLIFKFLSFLESSRTVLFILDFETAGKTEDFTIEIVIALMPARYSLLLRELTF